MRAAAMRFAKHKLLLVIILCVLIGASGVFYLAYTAIPTAVLRKDVVAILRIEGPILSPDVTSAYVDEIRKALRNDSIKAVVLVIDSPGGEVTQVEHIYMELLELKRAKSPFCRISDSGALRRILYRCGRGLYLRPPIIPRG